MSALSAKSVDRNRAFAGLEPIANREFVCISLMRGGHHLSSPLPRYHDDPVRIPKHQITGGHAHGLKLRCRIYRTNSVAIFGGPADAQPTREDRKADFEQQIAVANAAVNYKSTEASRPCGRGHNFPPIAMIELLRAVGYNHVSWLCGVDRVMQPKIVAAGTENRQGRAANPEFSMHRFDCTWHDADFSTSFVEGCGRKTLCTGNNIASHALEPAETDRRFAAGQVAERTDSAIHRFDACKV